MGPLIKANLIIAGICMSLAFLHLAIYIRRTELKAYLFFAVISFCMAGSSFFETEMYHAVTSKAFLSAFKNQVTCQGILWIGFAWFVAFYTGFARRWLTIAVTGLYVVSVVINLISPYGVIYSGIENFFQITLPWAEHISYANGPTNPSRVIPDIAWFLLIYLTIESLIRMGRKGQQRRAIYLGVVFFVFIGLEYLHGTLIDFGIMPPPSFFSFTFLGLILVMSATLVSEVVRASQLDREVESAEQKLIDEKERMDIILSSLNTGLALINQDMTVAWVNDMLRRILSWGEPVGKICYEFAEKKTEPCEGCGALMAFGDGQIHETERQSPIDGKWHYIVSIPIKDETGAVVQVLESTTDITVFKQTELTRDRAITKLEALKNQLEEENIYLKTEIRDARLFSDIIGKSNSLIYVLNRVDQVAETDATVLVLGETGTGKELISLEIHEKSERCEKPFVKVNCAALPSSLVESELFGHERGSFTGAEQRRKGRFELADGGTLFFDEISELPPETQAKLLRVLQDGQFERVGGAQTLKVDVRVISATNHDLSEEVAKGRFRPDLFYRLNVYPITVPPLRKRKEDIPLLVEYFIPLIASRIGKQIDQISPQMMEQFMGYDWPGNVRELKNVLERAIITTADSVLRLPSEFNKATKKQTENIDVMENLSTLDDVERRHILAVLKATNWRISGPDGAAKILGLNPSTLRSRLKKLEIERPQ